jgi:hypothetical protein
MFLLLALGALPPGRAEETTLPAQPTVTVDLRQEQSAAEREAALKRAEAVAAARGQSGRASSIPAVDRIAREALNEFPATPVRIGEADAAWRIRSRTPPEIFAYRVIAKLLRAGVKTWPGCAGDEWSGKYGDSRVAVRAEDEGVAVLVYPVSAPCADEAKKRQ